MGATSRSENHRPIQIAASRKTKPTTPYIMPKVSCTPSRCDMSLSYSCLASRVFASWSMTDGFITR